MEVKLVCSKHETQVTFKVGRKVVGVCAVDHYGTKDFIRDFVIFKEFRGKGYGSMAFDILLKSAIKAKEIGLDVYRDNISAVNIYLKAGFTFSDEREFTHMKKVITQ